MASTIENLKEEVLKLIEGPLKREGCAVAELVIATYRKSATVRAFVYSHGTMNVSRCAELSHLIGTVLDSTDLFESGYNLEVSSPGLDRPLKKAIDFRYRVGETVNVHFVPGSRPPTKAKIVGAGDTEVVFETESGVFIESLANIEKAKIVY